MTTDAALAAPAAGARAEAQRARFVPSAPWLGFWLAVVLCASKLAHWPLPGGDYGWQAWWRDVWVSTHADVAFAAAFGLLAAALLHATRRRPRVQAGLGAALLALGAFGALYAVASIQIFGFLRSPLTYPLLYLAGDMGQMSSSIGAFLTPGIVAGLVTAPFGYAAAVWLCSGRSETRRPSWCRRMTVLCVLLLAAAWVWQGRLAADGRWADRSDALIARSPHWEFLSSLVVELGSAGGPALTDTFPVEFLSDFRPPSRPASEPLSASTPAEVPGAAAAAATRPRNVLLVVLESTGAQYLSVYGSPYPTTPQLEAEAAHAAVFDSFYAHVGLTANSLFAMSLSAYPYMTWREYTIEHPRFPGRTLAETLGARGYRTVFLSSVFLDHGALGTFLANRGYDEVSDWRAFGRGEPLNSWGGSDAALVDRTLAWIDADRGRPFYGVLWTHASHHPYDPLPERPALDFFAGRERPADDYDLGRYLNTIAAVDHQMGRLFAGLRERGLAEDTIVLVTGDHGETFGEPHASWGHGFRVYEENVRVPLMIWSPALFAKGVRHGAIGGHVDLNPTIADLLGVPADGSWEGRSLLDADRPRRAYFYAANDDYLLGVRDGAFKYVYNASRGREELFDLAQDPDERRNLAAADPERCRVLRQRLAAWKHHAAERLAQAGREPRS